jgi:hypothetical protein
LDAHLLQQSTCLQKESIWQIVEFFRINPSQTIEAVTNFSFLIFFVLVNILRLLLSV